MNFTCVIYSLKPTPHVIRRMIFPNHKSHTAIFLPTVFQWHFISVILVLHQMTPTPTPVDLSSASPSDASSFSLNSSSFSGKHYYCGVYMIFQCYFLYLKYKNPDLSMILLSAVSVIGGQLLSKKCWIQYSKLFWKKESKRKTVHICLTFIMVYCCNCSILL